MLISVAKSERVSVAKRESAYASSLIVKAAALAACRRYRQLRQRCLGGNSQSSRELPEFANQSSRVRLY